MVIDILLTRSFIKHSPYKVVTNRKNILFNYNNNRLVDPYLLNMDVNEGLHTRTSEVEETFASENSQFPYYMAP